MSKKIVKDNINDKVMVGDSLLSALLEEYKDRDNLYIEGIKEDKVKPNLDLSGLVIIGDDKKTTIKDFSFEATGKEQLFSLSGIVEFINCDFSNFTNENPLVEPTFDTTVTFRNCKFSNVNCIVEKDPLCTVNFINCKFEKIQTTILDMRGKSKLYMKKCELSGYCGIFITLDNQTSALIEDCKFNGKFLYDNETVLDLFQMGEIIERDDRTFYESEEELLKYFDGRVPCLVFFETTFNAELKISNCKFNSALTALSVIGKSNVTVMNSTFTNGVMNIIADHDSHTTIIDSTFTDNNDDDIVGNEKAVIDVYNTKFKNGKSFAVLLIDKSKMNIYSSTISGYSNAFNLVSSCYLHAYDVTVYNIKNRGLVMRQNASADIVSCYFSNLHFDCLSLNDDTTITVDKCTFRKSIIDGLESGSVTFVEGYGNSNVFIDNSHFNGKDYMIAFGTEENANIKCTNSTFYNLLLVAGIDDESEVYVKDCDIKIKDTRIIIPFSDAAKGKLSCCTKSFR